MVCRSVATAVLFVAGFVMLDCTSTGGSGVSGGDGGACASSGAACQGPADCCSQACDRGVCGAPDAATDSPICGVSGEACTKFTDCCSLSCDHFRCTGCATDGACVSSGDCCSGVCDHGTCRAPKDASADAPADSETDATPNGADGAPLLDGGDARGDGGACKFEKDACNFCVANLCMAELSACNASTPCMSATPTFESCICAVQTSDAGTVGACRATYNAVNNQAHDLSSCITVSCDAQCL